MTVQGFSGSVLELANHLSKRAASDQSGIIAGQNPTHYDPANPIRLWIIQVAIIIGMTQVLSLILSKIRQPRVIAEVIGGIILGPTVMGRIPHFKNAIFPDQSMSPLILTANIGLVLFLFLVGLEIDTRIIKGNAKASGVISAAGLIVPLGMGAGLGAILYHPFIPANVNYGYFILFTAVAVGITAFPVLCRILIELKLLDTTVGGIVLSAGIGNDVIGWVLLALTVALVNASTGLTALWVLLAGIGWVFFMLYPVRFAFRWIARWTGSLSRGQPTAFMMTVTIFVVFASAFFTDVIGIHAIFGGFLAGLIVPNDNGFDIALVEKFEDLVSILFIPLYFALSGLRTNLGLLNNGTTWGYTILICVFAFVSKFVACAASAMAFGFNWRESGAIGSLMSCKGLVELIVLNVGLQAGVLNTRIFSMFVIHALVLTFITTPLVIVFYPEKYRSHISATQMPAEASGDEEKSLQRPAPLASDMKTKFSLVLDRVEHLSAAMTVTQLLQPPSYTPSSASIGSSEENKVLALPVLPMTPVQPRATIDALRLIELTERPSALLKSQAADALLHSDPVVSVFRTFGFLNRLPISATLSVTPQSEFASSTASHARERGSEMVVLPWTQMLSSDEHPNTSTSTPLATHNPFEGIFRQSPNQDASVSATYSDFIRKVFSTSPCDVALFLDRGVPATGSSYAQATDQHLFLPFFGGPDDRLALTFLVQLSSNRAVTATVVKMQKTETGLTAVSTVETAKADVHATISSYHLTHMADTVYGRRDTQTQLASDTADNLLWDKFTGPSHTRSTALTDALTRIKFTDAASPQPLHRMLELVAEEAKLHQESGRRLIMVVGRSRCMAVESHAMELREFIAEHAGVGSEVSRTLGDVGAAVVVAGTKASLLVLQASRV